MLLKYRDRAIRRASSFSFEIRSYESKHFDFPHEEGIIPSIICNFVDTKSSETKKKKKNHRIKIYPTLQTWSNFTRANFRKKSSSRYSREKNIQWYWIVLHATENSLFCLKQILLLHFAPPFRSSKEHPVIRPCLFFPRLLRGAIVSRPRIPSTHPLRIK